ncbi:hypothetical protein SSX86_017495 [Deinandra increscens subsp. villosa]|uniref:Uncharacterized protein n=1 Tax=Deinandra increscens subsp. villosa TaxID=3103831 RepID=A0AAP0D2J5_9ASTR
MFDPFILFLIKTIISSSQTLLTVKTLTTALAVTCSVVLPTVAGVALITYSANQAIHRKPLTFSSTLKSLSNSYTPLLHTVTAASMKLITILALTLSPIAVTEAIKSLGFDSDLLFIASTFVNTIVSYVFAFAILFFIVIWGSASAITVLESKSGFETLRQSADQSSEFRRRSFSILFLSGFVIVSALSSSATSPKSRPVANWMLILRFGALYLLSSLAILHYVVANTVLYVQYKAAIGEEIAMTTEKGEVSGEYVRVVVNDTDGEVVDEAGKDEGNGSFNLILALSAMVFLFLSFLQL